MNVKTKRKRHVLSEENIRLLERLCSIEGTDDEVRKDPNFVLNRFLTKINEMGIGSPVVHVMQFSVDRASLEGARRRMREGKAV